MTGFATVESVAAYLPEQNIDTDAIYPARFLLLMDRDGLGPYLFHDRRHHKSGEPKEGFILDQEPFSHAQVLIAGSGFGCGSSREQAVWTLTGFGIRCVIAPSFGEIFAGNAPKNGLLTLTLPEDVVARLGAAAQEGAKFRVDLEARALSVDGEKVASIDIPEGQRTALLNGWDETDILLREEGEAISTFEAQHRIAQPWLFPEHAK
jgi:3-isopropylmalate/(R)-2-methylmalate dehydratase small subunit